MTAGQKLTSLIMVSEKMYPVHAKLHSLRFLFAMVGGTQTSKNIYWPQLTRSTELVLDCDFIDVLID